MLGIVVVGIVVVIARLALGTQGLELLVQALFQLLSVVGERCVTAGLGCKAYSGAVSASRVASHRIASQRTSVGSDAHLGVVLCILDGVGSGLGAMGLEQRGLEAGSLLRLLVGALLEQLGYALGLLGIELGTQRLLLVGAARWRNVLVPLVVEAVTLHTYAYQQR